MWHTVLVTANETAFNHFFELRCPLYKYETSYGFQSYKSKKELLQNIGLPDEAKNYSNWTDLNWLNINESQADIHIQAIAELMYDSLKESKPKELWSGEWHIPFSHNLDLDSTSDKSSLEMLSKKINLTSMAYSEDMEQLALKISAARCARISYQTLGDNPKVDYEADIRLHDMLAESGHWSPFEHCARAMSDEEYYSFVNGQMNYEDWYDEMEIGTVIQYADMLPNKSHGWCRNFKGFIQYRHLTENI
jgi:hypothetical protein